MEFWVWSAKTHPVFFFFFFLRRMKMVSPKNNNVLRWKGFLWFLWKSNSDARGRKTTLSTLLYLLRYKHIFHHTNKNVFFTPNNKNGSWSLHFPFSVEKWDSFVRNSKNEIHLLEIAEVIAHDAQVWELIFTPSIFKNAPLFLFDFYELRTLNHYKEEEVLYEKQGA